MPTELQTFPLTSRQLYLTVIKQVRFEHKLALTKETHKARAESPLDINVTVTFRQGLLTRQTLS